jgi:endo-1,4-beta-xylanase
MLSRFVVSGSIACAMLATTVYGQESGAARPAAPQADADKAPAAVGSLVKVGSGTLTLTATAAKVAGLKDAFAGKFLIGAANDLGNLSQAEAANIKANYNVITPENCMKPQPTHPAEDRYTWGTPDRMVKWCEDNHIKVWGHTLVWHAQTANWFFEPGADGKPVTRELAMERLKSHITTVVGRYKGRLMGWDVVNEAINDGGGRGGRGGAAGAASAENLRNSNWNRLIGPEFLTLAFKWAHEADPQAELNYNDYNIEQGASSGGGKHASSMALLKRLLKDGAPITGVGIQGHWDLRTNLADVDKAISDYESLGLKVSISELDVKVAGTGTGAMPAGGGRGQQTSSPEAFQQQAKVYAKLFEIFANHAKSVERVTLWGLSDRRSWISSSQPLVFDGQLQPKPAYQAIIDVGLGKAAARP